MKKKVVVGLIDRELQAVSPEVLLGYEMKNLGGRSLRDMNQQHKNAVDKSEYWKSFSGPFACFLWGVVALAVLVPLLLSGVSLWIAVGLACLMCVAWEVTSQKTAKRAMLVIQEFRGLQVELERFSRAVENVLGMSDHMSVFHNEESIRKALVFRASKVLKLEEMFNDEISSRPPNVEQIVGYGEWLIKSRNEFKGACRCAESFGLDVDQGEVFSQARRLVKK